MRRDLLSLGIVFMSLVSVLTILNYRNLLKDRAPTRSSSDASVSARPFSPLDPPPGSAVALPSIRIDEKIGEKEVKRGIYGGKGDKKHLGGFTDFDRQGVSPAVWKHMVSQLGVKSVLDVGCGRGISTSWFKLHGVETSCVEGSHDAVVQSIVPGSESVVVEHDFSRGPWWPDRTVDAVWCVEFLEHVGRNFHVNYLPAFRKAALIFATHSRWGGWHHVEVHMDPWWKTKFELYGFVYSPELTDAVKTAAHEERKSKVIMPNGDESNAQHITLNMQVFINPRVASLPEHAHLMAEGGCYLEGLGGKRVNEPCGTGKSKDLTALPKEFLPLDIDEGMDKEWEDLVRRNVNQKEKGRL